MTDEQEIQGIAVLVDVYDTICEFSWLEESYRCARRRKRFRGDVMRFADKLEDNLFSIQDDLVNETYEVGSYHRFYVHEPKLRLVMALQFRDRIVQWAIYLVLNPFYDKMFIFDSYACRIDKGSHRAAARLQYWLQQVERKPGRWYYLKLDISKYFYRVDHAVLLEILSRRIKDERLFRLLEKIINSKSEPFGLPRGAKPEDVAPEDWLYDVGMPIGNLTSQLFANIYLNELDQYCKHELHLHFYIRYMDDVIILLDSKEKLWDVRRKIESFLNEVLHLDLNNKTTIRPCDHGVDFVGYMIYADHIKLKHKAATHMMRSVKCLSAELAAKNVEREYFDRVAASFNGVLEHCDSAGLRRKLNTIYLNAIGKDLPHGEQKAEHPETQNERACHNCRFFHYDTFCGYTASYCDVYSAMDYTERDPGTAAASCGFYQRKIKGDCKHDEIADYIKALDAY